MKIRKNYVLLINGMTRYAFFGGPKFNARVSSASDLPFCTVLDCNLKQLKHNIKVLKEKGFGIIGMKH